MAQVLMLANLLATAALFANYNLPQVYAANVTAHAEGTWGDLVQTVDLSAPTNNVTVGDNITVTATATIYPFDLTRELEKFSIGLAYGQADVVSYTPAYNWSNNAYVDSGGVHWITLTGGTFTVTLHINQLSSDPVNVPRIDAYWSISPSVRASIYLNGGSNVITINTDGSFSPSNAPVTASQNIYTVQSNISIPIIVYRNNAVLDGANHKVSNVKNREAILLKANGAVIKNFQIEDCTWGIRQQLCSQSTIQNNTIYNTDFSIKLENSTSSTVTRNNINHASQCIFLDASTNNTVSLNNCTGGVAAGIMLQSSNGNIVNQNSLLNNAIFVGFSNANRIVGNQVTNTKTGYECISLSSSSSNTVTGNLLSNQGSGNGIELMSEKYDTIYSNIISNCSTGIELLSGNSFIKVSSNSLTDNSQYGIELFESDNNAVFSNTIKLSRQEGTVRNIAVELGNSSSNAIYGNTISVYPIVFHLNTGSNNRIYGNKMLDPQPIVVLYNTINVNFDNGYPSGGNYWSDYVGNDVYSGVKQEDPGNDGIGDLPYKIRAYDNINFDTANAIPLYDYYPLMLEWSTPIITKVTVNGVEDVVTIVTKTSILQVASVANMLSFTVSGPDSTKGYARITCPKDNTTALRVYMDGAQIGSTVTSDDTNYYVFFQFSLSTHQVTIPFTPQNVVTNPGFESGLSGWSTSQGNAAYSTDSSTTKSGNFSAKGIEINSGSLGRLYQNVTNLVPPGSICQISGWIKTSNVTGYGAVIALSYVDSNGGTPNDGYVNIIGLYNSTQNWKFFQSANFTLPTMPSDAKQLWFLFDFYASTGTAWFDDVSLLVFSSPSSTQPTAYKFNVTANNQNYPIDVVSNSTITDMAFNSTARSIAFSATGDTGTKGYCEISIPSTLISGQLTVYKDGALLTRNVDYMETNNGTNVILQISYSHSTHNFQIIGSAAIPEFQSILPVTLVAFSAITTIMVIRRIKWKAKKGMF